MVRQDFHGKSEKMGKIAKSESISWQPKMGTVFGRLTLEPESRKLFLPPNKSLVPRLYVEQIVKPFHLMFRVSFSGRKFA